jgi:cbb3-type cytochrome oxidase subunit 3
MLILADGMLFVEIALVIFMVVFLGIVAWVLLSRPGKYRKAARIPLEDSVVTPREDGQDAPARSQDENVKEHTT